MPSISSGGKLEWWTVSPRILDSPERIGVLRTFAAEAATSLPQMFGPFVFSEDKRKERKPLFLCCSQAENLLGLEVPHLGLRRRKTLHTCVQNSIVSLFLHLSLARICLPCTKNCLFMGAIYFVFSFFKPCSGAIASEQHPVSLLYMPQLWGAWLPRSMKSQCS